jgi:hypothetical protein
MRNGLYFQCFTAATAAGTSTGWPETVSSLVILLLANAKDDPQGDCSGNTHLARCLGIFCAGAGVCLGRGRPRPGMN